MPAFLVQIDGYDPVAAAAVTLRASSVDDDRVCHLNGETWLPAVSALPSLRYDLVDAAFSGRIDTPASQLGLSAEAFPNLPRYALTDARVRLWAGEPGDAWGSYVLRFDGRVTAQARIVDGSATIPIAVDDRWLDTPLLTLYAGTGGAEGDAGLKGTAKPLAIGAPRFCPAKLVDATNLVFQLSAYGLIEDVETAFERAIRFSASVGDYASYAALVAATIPAGKWATAKAVGMVRHGAPPVQGGRFAYDVKGDKAGPDAWVRLPGQVIKRLALLVGGTGKFDEASLDTLDAARPWNISWHLADQITAREAIQRIAASVNAVMGVSWTSQLFVAPLPALPGSASITLDATGASLPAVSKVEQIEIDLPYWRMAIETERTWDVHALSDVAWTAVLVDRGLYEAAETYREGHIVDLANGSRWLYINPTPTSGNAPPTSGTSNAYWDQLKPPTTAEDIGVAAGAGTTLKLTAFGATPPTIIGNSIKSAVGGYNTAVRGDPMGDACFAETDIVSGAYTMVALDRHPTGDHWTDQTVVAHLFVGTTGDLAVYVDGVGVFSAAGLSLNPGKMRVVYDGSRYRIFLSGVEYGAGVAGLKAAGPNLTHWPKFWAYDAGITQTGINVGTFTDRATLLPGWVGIGTTMEIIGDRFRKTGGVHNSYDGAVVGGALRGGGYVSVNIYRAGFGAGWYSQVVLDDDNTTTALASQKWMLEAYDDASNSQFTVRLYKDGNLVAGPVSIAASSTRTHRLTLAYDGVRIIGMVDGVPVSGMTYATGVPENVTYYPKALAWQQTGLDVDPGPRWFTGLDYGFFTNNSFADIAGVGRPSDNAGSSLILVTAGTANAYTQTGNAMLQSGGTGSYTQGFHSVGRFAGAAACSFRMAGACVVGLNSDPSTGPDYVNIDYSIHRSGANVYVYENGVGGLLTGGATDDSVYTITYDGLAVRYYITASGVTSLLKTTLAAAGMALHFQASTAGGPAWVRDILFWPFFSNAWSDVGGVGRPSDNATSDLNLIPVDAAKVKVTGNSVGRIDAAGAWTAGFNSSQSFVGGAVCSWTVAQITTAYVFGFNEGPITNAADNWNQIDYGVNLNGATINVYINGILRGNFGAIAVGDRLTLVSDNLNLLLYRTTAAGATTLIDQMPVLSANRRYHLVGTINDALVATAATNLRLDPYSNQNWNDIGGLGRPANNAGTAVILAAANSGVASSITIQGNSISQNVGVSYAYAVVASALYGPCYVEQDIYAAGWNFVILDNSAGQFAEPDQSAYGYYYAPSGSYGIVYNSVVMMSGTAAAGLTGKVVLIFDGVNCRLFVAGVQRGTAVPANPDFTGGGAIYPKWWPYHASVTYTGLQAGYFSDNNWASVGGVGRPADNATSDLSLVAFGSGEVTANQVRFVVGGSGYANGAYSRQGIVGPFVVEAQCAITGDNLVGVVGSTLLGNGSGDFWFSFNFSGGFLYAYEPQTAGSVNLSTTYTANDVCRIVYDGLQVRYYKNDTLLRTVAMPLTSTSWRLQAAATANGQVARSLRFMPFTNNDFAAIGGTTRPSDNAGTSGLLTLIGTGSKVIGNTVYKEGGTHGAADGGAVARPQFGSCYISATIINPTVGGGWYSVLTLDDDATSFALASQRYMLQVIPFGPTSVSWYLMLNNATQASGTANLGLTLNSRMAIVYDGTTVYGVVDGLVLGTIINQSPGQTLFPKVIDFHQNAASNPRYDIQHGPWSENAWQRITGAGRPSDNAGTTINLVSVDTSLVTITGNGADKISGGTAWNAGFNSLESYVGAVALNWFILDTAGAYLVGVNEVPITNAANNYNQIDYAVQQDGANVHAYANGSHFGLLGTVAAGDQLTILVDNATITLIKTTAAGTVSTLHTTAVLSINRRYFLTGTLGANGAKVRGLRFEPYFDRLIDNVVDTASYARVAAGELVSNLIKLGIAGSGKQLGDQRNLKPITAMNLGYKFTGAITYSASAGTPATATISIGAGSALIGSVSVSYNAMSIGVTGTGGSIVDYYLYVDDLNFAGGSLTLVATTAGNDIFASNSRVWLGVCSVSYPTSGGGSGGGGGGGGYCVAADSFLPGHELASDIVEGDEIVVLDYRTLAGPARARVTGNDLATVDCVELRTASGIRLVCSETTPVTYRDGSVDSVLGCARRELPVLDHGEFRWEQVVSVASVGARPVARIHVGGATYAAGAQRDRFIFTHNPNNPKP